VDEALCVGAFTAGDTGCRTVSGIIVPGSQFAIYRPCGICTKCEPIAVLNFAHAKCVREYTNFKHAQSVQGWHSQQSSPAFVDCVTRYDMTCMYNAFSRPRCHIIIYGPSSVKDIYKPLFYFYFLMV